jgi:hypothetical protein
MLAVIGWRGSSSARLARALDGSAFCLPKSKLNSRNPLPIMQMFGRRAL